MADSDLSGVLELYAEAVPKHFLEQLARDLLNLA
jgi:hypothetical protein